MQTQDHLWAIILAGGDGRRLKTFRVAESEIAVPKQYRLFDGQESMLQWTVRRAEAIVPRHRVVAIVAREHDSWWPGQLGSLEMNHVVIQSRNRGTAAGNLLPLLLVLKRDPEAVVVILPSDHYVENEASLLETICHATKVARYDQTGVVLVGIDVTQGATDYDWIVPGSAFREEPDLPTLQELRHEGALVNSLILAARGRALLELYLEAKPGLVEPFCPPGKGCAFELEEMQAIYDKLPTCDFSREILERSPDRLLVHEAPSGYGWSDLGTPARMRRFLERRQAAAA